MTVLSLIAAALALLPLLMATRNLQLFAAPAPAAPPGTRVSVLIPARDEEENIGAAIEAALAETDLDLEVVVLDDHSRDRTAAIVAALAERDPRVRLERAPPLPPGWVGKQHACHVLAERARHPVMLFVDADVRLAPGAVSRAAGFLLARDLGLASGFPRQEAGTFAERLLIPLMHVLLLGYLPIDLMRRRADPSLGAGCGQLIIVRREAYERAGGHAAIRDSMHDGIKLPRAFRRAGLRTDLFDAADLASCRMYEGARALWAGFSKNATEGMATPTALPVWTLLLFGGHVLPWLLLVAALAGGGPPLLLAAAGLGVAANLLLRLVLLSRFRQSWLGAVLHPLGVLAMLALQWSALINQYRGRPAVWRDRAYSG